MVTPISFERGVLGCVVLPAASSDDTERLIELFASACGVALNNALTHAHQKRISAIDPLTGAANRRAGLEILEREIDRAHRGQRMLAVLMIDLDHFKQINDRHGHLAGDRHLTAVAHAMQELLRDTDALLRYGGEEFLVILPGADAAAARSVAERVRQDVAAACATPGVATTTSIGWATLAAQERLPQLLERADRALYQSKAAGRDCIRSAEPAVSELASARTL